MEKTLSSAISNHHKEDRNTIEYFYYYGKCRVCGGFQRWKINKSIINPNPDVTDVAKYMKYIQEHRFPSFIEYCDECEHTNVVFDLIRC